MQRDIIKVYKNHMEYLTQCNNRLSRMLKIIHAKVILHSEDMIIKSIVILKGKNKNVDSIIESFIAQNFYNYKSMLFHHEIININEKENAIILYCLNYNDTLFNFLQNYNKFSIVPIQNIITKYVKNKIPSDKQKIVFYKYKSVVMLLMIFKNLLIYTSIIKDFKVFNMNDYINEAIIEGKNTLSMECSKNSMILININMENNLNEETYHEAIDEIIFLDVSESELIRDYVKKQI